MIVATKPVEETLPLGEPAYYEVWGGLESANKALWAALWFSTTFAILALILVRVVIRRPPVVIRVDDAGQAQVIADQRENIKWLQSLKLGG